MNKKFSLPPPPCQERKKQKEYYGALDGIRAYAAIGIVMMHVLDNITIKPSINAFSQIIIPFFSNFVFLFMMISAFGVSCGYYSSIKNKQVSPEEFL